MSPRDVLPLSKRLSTGASSKLSRPPAVGSLSPSLLCLPPGMSLPGACSLAFILCAPSGARLSPAGRCRSDRPIRSSPHSLRPMAAPPPRLSPFPAAPCVCHRCASPRSSCCQRAHHSPSVLSLGIAHETAKRKLRRTRQEGRRACASPAQMNVRRLAALLAALLALALLCAIGLEHGAVVVGQVGLDAVVDLAQRLGVGGVRGVPATRVVGLVHW